MGRGATLVEVGPGFNAAVQARLVMLLGDLSHLFGNRGFGTVVNGIARWFSPDNYGVFDRSSGGRIKVRLGDGYWLPALRGASYEPEMKRFLTMHLGPGSVFLDCGANIGWWSVFASSLSPGPDEVIAVEASTRTFGMLQDNAALNSDRFKCVHAAVWSASRQQLVLREATDQHAWASVDADVQHALARHRYADEVVTTTTIDDLLAARLDSATSIVVKLDVEGAEIEALKGATRAIERGAVIIYEDHGRDPEARVSNFVIGQLGRTVLHFDERGDVVELPDVTAVRKVKSDPRRGYNFVAVSRSYQSSDGVRRP